MPAEIELLKSTEGAGFMKNNGNQFCIEAGAASSAYWRVTPQRNLLQLCKSGEVILSRQLEPRLMQLLCLLAEAEGSVLTRDALMATLWPRVIVNENSLTRAVSELRKAFSLPDDPVIDTANVSSSGMIETVPKRGYRLNADLIPNVNESLQGRNTSSPPYPISTLAGKSHFRQTIARYSALRYPAIAAAMVISAALSSVWTLKLSDMQDIGQSQQMAESSYEAAPANVSVTQQLEDRVLRDSSSLPDGLHWLESVHNEFDNLPGLPTSHISETVLAPGGQMMAFVEDFPGQSQLRLRSLASPEEAWTVFTSSSPITHLQWSPLDAGLLFTVEDKDSVANNIVMQDALANSPESSARLSRLMLLDLETLQIRELYRRMVPAGDDQIRTVGSLT